MCGLLPKISFDRASYHTVLLDFDGTIVPSEKIFLQSWQEVFNNKCSCTFTQEEYVKYELEQDAKLIDYLISCGKLSPKISVSNLMNEVYNRYAFYFQQMLEKYDFTKTLEHILQWFKIGIKLGIVSTSRRNYIAMFFEKNKKYRDIFSCIFCREDVKELKPNPMVYWLACHELKTSPLNCIVIEDSLKGIKGAISANMQVVRVLKNSIFVDDYVQKYTVPTVASIEDIVFIPGQL